MIDVRGTLKRRLKCQAGESVFPGDTCEVGASGDARPTLIPYVLSLAFRAVIYYRSRILCRGEALKSA